ncbi:acyltransferase family protein [Pseudoduganella sp. LjRoot289]|uniref:acyltransferase family protein n=1 Tax=Pseudoduganella sp. LjRoot289 TaxID=3342314 RepID=UPI003F50AF0B
MKAVAANSGSANAAPAQFGLINLLKAGAAQLIVLHHLAFYGPMSDHARALMPDLIVWLEGNARIAVQVFLVVGGFLAAKSLSPAGLPGLAAPLQTVWRRYTKLAPPFLAATLLAAAASALAGAWMTHGSISAPLSIPQLCAHALLLHGVLGYPSLSAGAWYVAIDFQLYAAMVLLLWTGGRLACGQKSRWLMPLLVLAAVSASLLHFNLDRAWDDWAPYFIGSYGLGVLAWWAGDTARRPGAVALLVAMILLPALAALIVDFRSRIALALAVACLLFVFGRVKTGAGSGRAWRLVGRLATTSYSVFLVHFPVCLVVNAAFTRFVPPEPHFQAAGMALAWAASLAAGAAFYRWVELPLGRMVSAPNSPAASTWPKMQPTGRVLEAASPQLR